MASNITVADLTAEGGANQINLQWSIDDPHANGHGLPYLTFHHAEIRYADNVDMIDAVTLSENVQFSYSHLNLLAGSEFYYQVRAVDGEGQFGEWCDPVLGQENTIDASAINTPWDDFTPTVRYSTGTIGGYTLGTCRQKQTGLLQLFEVEFSIDDVGSGSGAILVDGIPNQGPFTVHGIVSAIYEDSASSFVAVSGALINGSGGDSQIVITGYDGSSLSVEKTYRISGCFEIAV